MGAMETMGEYSLLTLLETTTAEWTFFASAPTVGSKLTQKISPCLIDSVGNGSLQIGIDPFYFLGGVLVLNGKLPVASRFEGIAQRLTDKAASPPGLHLC